MPLPKTTRNKPKRCVKPTAFPCKNTCLPRLQPSGKSTNCRNPLKGQAKTAVEWLTYQQTRLDQINKNRSSRGVSAAKLNAAGYIVTDKMTRAKPEPLPTNTSMPAIAVLPKKQKSTSSKNEAQQERFDMLKERRQIQKEMRARANENESHWAELLIMDHAPLIWQRELSGLKQQANTALENAKKWATTPATKEQVKEQKAKIKSEERRIKQSLNGRGKGVEFDWLGRQAASLSLDKEWEHEMMDSLDYEQSLLKAMQGDKGIALQSYFRDRQSYVSGKLKDSLDPKKVKENRKYHQEKMNEAEAHQKALKKALEQLKKRKILGVRLMGNDTEDYKKVRSAYLKLAKQHHPDVGGDPAEFRKVQAEWEVFVESRIDS